MPDLPIGCKVKKTTEGKAVVTHTNDRGEEYIARRCDGPEVTEQDVSEMMSLDRERNTAADVGRRAIAEIERNQAEYAAKMEEDFAEPAERVAHAGLHREGLTVGYSRRYSDNFEAIEW